MLVYGDATVSVSADAKVDSLFDLLARAEQSPVGIVGHGWLAAAFVEASELVQAISDADFNATGCDEDTALQRTAMGFLTALAGIISHSWRSGFSSPLANRKRLCAVIAMAETLRSRTTLACKSAEGFALYALYPETLIAAAATLPTNTSVIGLRSIGTGLSALAAVGAGTAAPITLRPVGHPFRRELRLSPGLRSALLQWCGDFAVVDEGPGLSGSSFGCVADFLEDGGVHPARVHFLPSHLGDVGPEASPRHRHRWETAVRHVASFDSLFLAPARSRTSLPAWVEDLTGPALAPLQDISGGSWRRLSFLEESEWPPVYASQERRKFLLETASGTWLLKFVGLGRAGYSKLEVARQLQTAGFGPDVLGLRYGFLVERWIRGREQLAWQGPDREELLQRIAAYLTFRARRLPAANRRGASAAELAGMAEVNTGEALGPEWGSLCRTCLGVQRDLIQRDAKPVVTDGRLHSWEWIKTSNGRILKTDGLDHHDAHDMIGCQDIAWDIAAAIEEFELSDQETAMLCTSIANDLQRRIEPTAIAFYSVCYLAFQIGLWTFAESSATEAGEKTRVRQRVDRCCRQLLQTLSGGRGLAGRVLERK